MAWYVARQAHCRSVLLIVVYMQGQTSLTASDCPQRFLLFKVSCLVYGPLLVTRCLFHNMVGNVT